MDTVRSWMSTPAIIACDTESLPHARTTLVSEGIRRLPVVNATGDLVGIVTEGDINRISDSPESDVHEYNLYYRVHDLPLREIMRRPVITVTPETPLREAAHLMLAWRISGLPVLAHGRIIGVITVSDLLRRLISDEADVEYGPLSERSTGLD